MLERAADGVKKEHVYITVSGGVAYVAQVTGAVEVHIIDFDNLKADYEAVLACLSPEEKVFLSTLESDENIKDEFPKSLD